jgi:hypothetical protein
MDEYMENKLILTYGLNEHQNQILADEFSPENVCDVTDGFTDLLVVPAAAAVINSDLLTEEEKTDINGVFSEDYDTCISVFGSWDTMDMNFMHISEKDPEHFDETIEAIKRRFSIKADHDKAEKRAKDAISGVTRLIKDDAEGSLRDQIIHMNSYSQPYEKLTAILDHIHELPSREKTVYKDELQSVLYAFMAAHNLIQIPEIDDDKDFKDFPEFCLDREWMKKMSDYMKEHYNQTIEKREIHK